MSFQNPWWAEKKKVYDDDHLRKVLSSNPRFLVPPIGESSLILGPRQVGKTTYLKTTIMDLLERGLDPTKVFFFSCDALKTKEDLVSLLSQYRSLINSEGGYIFLDEVTFIEDWNVGVLYFFYAGDPRGSVGYVNGSSTGLL